MALEPLGILLGKHLQTKPGMAGPMQTARIVDAAARILAERFPRLAARLSVVSFKDGALTVAAGSGAAAAELRLREGQLLAALRETLGPGTVRAIRYRL